MSLGVGKTRIISHGAKFEKCWVFSSNKMSYCMEKNITPTNIPWLTWYLTNILNAQTWYLPFNYVFRDVVSYDGEFQELLELTLHTPFETLHRLVKWNAGHRHGVCPKVTWVWLGHKIWYSTYMYVTICCMRSPKNTNAIGLTDCIFEASYDTV